MGKACQTSIIGEKEVSHYFQRPGQLWYQVCLISPFSYSFIFQIIKLFIYTIEIENNIWLLQFCYFSWCLLVVWLLQFCYFSWCLVAVWL